MLCCNCSARRCIAAARRSPWALAHGGYANGYANGPACVPIFPNLPGVLGVLCCACCAAWLHRPRALAGQKLVMANFHGVRAGGQRRGRLRWEIWACPTFARHVRRCPARGRGGVLRRSCQARSRSRKRGTSGAISLRASTASDRANVCSSVVMLLSCCQNPPTDRSFAALALRPSVLRALAGRHCRGNRCAQGLRPHGPARYNRATFHVRLPRTRKQNGPHLRSVGRSFVASDRAALRSASEQRELCGVAVPQCWPACHRPSHAQRAHIAHVVSIDGPRPCLGYVVLDCAPVPHAAGRWNRCQTRRGGVGVADVLGCL